MRRAHYFLSLFQSRARARILPNMILTRENIHAALNNGSANRKQIEAFGLTWPPAKGWLSALIGTEITDEKYEKVRSLCKSRSRKYSEPDLESQVWL